VTPDRPYCYGSLGDCRFSKRVSATPSGNPFKTTFPQAPQLYPIAWRRRRRRDRALLCRNAELSISAKDDDETGKPSGGEDGRFRFAGVEAGGNICFLRRRVVTLAKHSISMEPIRPRLRVGPWPGLPAPLVPVASSSSDFMGRVMDEARRPGPPRRRPAFSQISNAPGNPKRKFRADTKPRPTTLESTAAPRLPRRQVLCRPFKRKPWYARTGLAKRRAPEARRRYFLSRNRIRPSIRSSTSCTLSLSIPACRMSVSASELNVTARRSGKEANIQLQTGTLRACNPY